MQHLLYFNRGGWWLLTMLFWATLPANAAAPTFFAARNGSSTLVFFAIFIGLAIVGTLISSYFAARRRAALQQTASQLGFQFQPDASVATVLAGAEGLELFKLGRSPQVKNVMTHAAGGVAIRIFDYQYTTGSGKNRSTHQQTVLLFHLPGTSLPSFTLRPESIFHKLGSVFGYQDIDFATHPKFSAQYLVRGPVEPAIRQAFTSAVLDFFESQPQCCVEANGSCLIVFRPMHCVKPENIPPFLETGVAVLAAFGVAQLTLGEDGRLIG